MGDGSTLICAKAVITPSSTAGKIVLKLSSTRITSAASLATSVPLLPIDTPMSAILSAGASLTATDETNISSTAI